MKNYKKEFNTVQIENISMLGMSVWVYDLAIATKYYDQISPEEAITTICQKYKKADNLLC